MLVTISISPPPPFLTTVKLVPQIGNDFNFIPRVSDSICDTLMVLTILFNLNTDSINRYTPSISICCSTVALIQFQSAVLYDCYSTAAISLIMEVDQQMLPVELTKLPLLEKLFLDNNKLTVLPPELGVLKNLRVLTVEYNMLVSVLVELRQCVGLVELSLEHNKLICPLLDFRAMAELHKTQSLPFKDSGYKYDGENQSKVNLVNYPYERVKVNSKDPVPDIDITKREAYLTE
ncbi:hypothetical protein L1887_11015 [Cichorium endivia]|nr:hypothetical protein L1887_11015 [Cichorium endivia]